MESHRTAPVREEPIKLQPGPREVMLKSPSTENKRAQNWFGSFYTDPRKTYHMFRQDSYLWIQLTERSQEGLHKKLLSKRHGI